MELRNLEMLHPSVRSDVEAYCEKLVSALAARLAAVSVYGSATGPDFIPGKSNVNLAVVVDRLDQDLLDRMLDIVKWGKKKNVVAPLLLTVDYIESSRDVFPIEFVEIRDSQVLLMGTDHFSSLEISREHLRLECESQLKAAVLRTRQAYLEVGSVKRGAEAVLHASLTSLIPVFRAMLKLKGLEVPGRKLDVVMALGEAFGADQRPFVAILHDKAGDEKIAGREARGVLARYITDIETLAKKVDQL
jgi:hypothetical protein